MTNIDIIAMALESGFPIAWISDNDGGVIRWADIERFAALVAAAERDRMCEQFNIPKELAYEKAKSNEAD